MRVSYSAGYCVTLPERHPFPMGKYPALYHLLRKEGLIGEADVITPREASWADLGLVHTPAYIQRLVQGTLSRHAERRIGMPWSEALIRRARLAVQGTINAAMMALEDGIAANLAGGTHHAFADHGEGFCIFNDVAVTTKLLSQSKWIRRVLVVDLDVHQGNGTATIFADDSSVYTFSMHGAKNYPFRKAISSCDVALPDGTDDHTYLAKLRKHLPKVIASSNPDLVFYLAGIDVLEADRLGRLALTPEGLRRRDRYVLETVREAGLPLVILMAGGYAATPEQTARYHAIVHQEYREYVNM